MLTIKELADITKMSADTIRYYEKIGIIPEPNRKPNGYRSYDEVAVIRLKFIIKAKELGFTLKEIKLLFSHALDPNASCNDISDIANDKIRQIDQQIHDLISMKDLLHSFSTKCDPSYSIEECPIIRTLMENTEKTDD